MPYITLPVVDLRREPKNPAEDFSHDDLRDSQLLYNEEISIERAEGDWLKILATEQFDYPGWIHVSEASDQPRRHTTHVISALMTPLDNQMLSYGTELTEEEAGRMNQTAIRPIPIKVDKTLLLEEAKLFLDAPYLWGGRSAPLPGKAASVDCSGLINLLYRAQGKHIPRDAHDQYLTGKSSKPIPGMPIYLKKKERFTHVVIYLSQNLCLESPETGKPVRLSPMTWKKDQIHIADRAPESFAVKDFFN